MGAPAHDHAAMSAALTAARDGRRGANPLVGAAIRAADGQIVTGRHLGAGTPHAEVDAITTAHRHGIDLTTSTLFVTLEPCAHTGRTGPCTQAILDAGIPDVVFALPDTTEPAGGGGALLAEAGVRVRSGLGSEESASPRASTGRPPPRIARAGGSPRRPPASIRTVCAPRSTRSSSAPARRPTTIRG